MGVLAARLRRFGAVRVSAPADSAERLGEGCDALLATGLLPVGRSNGPDPTTGCCGTCRPERDPWRRRNRRDDDGARGATRGRIAAVARHRGGGADRTDPEDDSHQADQNDNRTPHLTGTSGLEPMRSTWMESIAAAERPRYNAILKYTDRSVYFSQ